MSHFFGEYARIIVFLHVVSAVVWVGGMIAIRIAVHPSLQGIDDPKMRLGKTLQIVGRLFHLVIPFILILIATALLISVGLGFRGTDLYWLVHAKEAIWTIMTLNFIYMYLRRKKALRLFEKGDLPSAGALMKPLPNLLLPVNIVLGMVAIFAGVVLRGV